MKSLSILLIACILPLVSCQKKSMQEESNGDRIVELNALWHEVSRSVRQGDFEAYRATCHKEGVLVAGVSKKAYPLSKALAKWKVEFDDTKSGDRKSDVKFRFSRRLGDATTAHEEGVFLYTAQTKDGKNIEEYIFFEALLVKNDGWKIIMEYQKAKATRLDWDQLSPMK